MKRLLILFLSIFLLVGQANGQGADISEVSTKFLQSPNAANLGLYGNTDISPFTGLPQISFGLFTVKQNDITVSANLSYLGGGVKPEDHPGWMGQNWTLNVGGVVTRKINGDIDERYNYDSFSNPYGYSYFMHPEALSSANWDQPSFLTTYYDGGDNNKKVLLSPDEFSFTLPNGKSGSFFYQVTTSGTPAQWIVKTNQPGKMSVSVTLETSDNLRIKQPTLTGLQPVSSFFRTLVVTDDDGFKYTFGDSVDAIEWSRGPNNGLSYSTYDLTANAWYLVKIESPLGNIVNFVYERGTHQFTQSVSSNQTLSIATSNQSSCGSSYKGLIVSTQIITPSYLKEINAGSFKVTFEKEESNDPYPVFYSDHRQWAGYNYWDTGNVSSTTGDNLITNTPTKWYKLKKIKVFNANNSLDQNMKEYYTFNYSTDNAPIIPRLYLTGFARKDPGKGYQVINDSFDPSLSQDMEYKFSYNQLERTVSYNSMETDEWGYYNGKPYPYNATQYSFNELMKFFEPDSVKMKIGTLTRVDYPTGGHTNFYYEPNDYSQRISKTPNAVNLEPVSGFGGGLRIKKIINYTDEITGASSKEYVYKNSGTGLSSGIMDGKKQYRITTKIGTSSVWASADYISYNSLSDVDYTNGRDVVYSEVKEIQDDGSYSIYKYSNSDNVTYRDEVDHIYSDGYAGSTDYSINLFTFNSSYSFPMNSHTSRDVERGQLLSKTTFTAAGLPVYQQLNQYRDDAARFNEFVKGVNYKAQSISCSGNNLMERYIEPVKYYTYLPYLKSQKETTWDVNGENAFAVTKNFIYDHSLRLLRTENAISSKGEDMATTYTYPPDITGSSDPGGIYSAMTQFNITSPVIIKTSTRATVQTSRIKTNYSHPTGSVNSMYVPLSEEVQSTTSSSSDKRIDYKTWDIANGNILTIAQADGVDAGHIWGYNGQYPIAVAKNANNLEVFHQNFEELSTATVAADETPAHTGKKYYLGATYTATFTRPDTRNYIISFWYRLNGKWNIKQADYNGSSFACSGGDAYDDIAIYPKDAQLSTYTFDPLVGMTSAIDAGSKTTYYEYDYLNRLKTIRDEYRNAVKTLCYNLLGNVAGCTIPGVAYNTEQYGEFTKACSVGSSAVIRYTVPKGRYSSSIDVTDANAKAMAEVNAFGQQLANQQGHCTIYAKINVTSSYSTTVSGYTRTYKTYAIGLFNDAACTSPAVVSSPVTVNYRTVSTTSNSIDPTITQTNNLSVVIQAGTSSTSIGQYVKGCAPPGGGTNPPPADIIAASGAKNQSTQSNVGTNGVQPPPGGDPGGPQPVSVCSDYTITLLAGVGYEIAQ